jgi:hypothetical protein
MPLIQNNKPYVTSLSGDSYYSNVKASSTNGYRSSNNKKAEDLTKSVLYNKAVLYNNWQTYK